MALQFIATEKGKKKLCEGGHCFFKDKTVDEKTHWRCEKYQQVKCPARVTTVEDEIVKRWKEHNHAGDAAKVEAAKILDNIRNSAKNTRDTPHFILSNASVGCSQAAAAKLPSVNTIKRSVRNIRQRQDDGPAIPQHRSEIIFPEDYKITLNGQEFLLFDSGYGDENRILIFASRRNLQLLARSENWYADGTFKTVPHLFYQIFTLHGFKNNLSLPLVYALLPNKREETYAIFFRKIKELEPSVSPTTVTTDFEKAMVNAIRAEFPQIRHQGCFFHFCQSIFRKIQTNGLQPRYETDADFALSLRFLSALAFVPTDSVVEVFEEMCDNNIFPPEAQEVVDYFEDTWIGRPNRRQQRRPPQFDHAVWNCYEAVLQELPKTNNSLEGWHMAFEQQVSAHHPNIWKFIAAIKREQSLTELRIEQSLSGEEPPRPKKKYRDSAQRLRRVVGTYHNADMNILDYLRGIAHNITF